MVQGRRVSLLAAVLPSPPAPCAGGAMAIRGAKARQTSLSFRIDAVKPEGARRACQSRGKGKRVGYVLQMLNSPLGGRERL